jgi:translation initiation factor 3 subunit K
VRITLIPNRLVDSSPFENSNSYQFNPDLYNPDVVINILIKALTSTPFPDFNLCISLLDDRPANTNPDEPDPLPSLLPLLTELHTLLQQCRFPAFWQLYRSDKAESLRDNYTVECVGFEDAVRAVVVQTVKAAFRRIGSERLGTYLDLAGTSRPYFDKTLVIGFVPHFEKNKRGRKID